MPDAATHSEHGPAATTTDPPASTTRPGGTVLLEAVQPVRAPMIDGSIVVALGSSNHAVPATVWAAQECRRRAVPVHLLVASSNPTVLGLDSGSIDTDQAVSIARREHPDLLITVSAVTERWWDAPVRYSSCAPVVVVPLPPSAAGLDDTRHLLAVASCPVVITTGTLPDPLTGPDMTCAPVLAVVDPQAGPEALTEALTMASRRWTGLTVVVTTASLTDDPWIRELLDGFPDVRTQLIVGSSDLVGDTLTRAEYASLLVVSEADAVDDSTGRSLLDGWSHRTPCPLMVVPHRRPAGRAGRHTGAVRP